MSLLTDLRMAGLNMVGIAGWETHSRPYSFDPIGIINHHTAGTNSIGIIVKGRKGLPGPLSQFLVDKDGTINLVSQGYCNHAGRGVGEVLERMRNNQPPLGNAPSGGTNFANRYTWGIEIENLGNGSDPYPAEQMAAVVALNVALCRFNEWGPNQVIGHKEWTARKVDPSFDMFALRGAVASALQGEDMFLNDITAATWRAWGKKYRPAEGDWGEYYPTASYAEKVNAFNIVEQARTTQSGGGQQGPAGPKGDRGPVGPRGAAGPVGPKPTKLNVTEWE